MKDTRFFLPAAERDRLAAVYSSGPDGTIVRAPEGAAGPGPLRRRTAQELLPAAPACSPPRATTPDSSR